MSADPVNKELAALLDGDDAIAAALAGVEAKLDAWLSAMRAGQAAIVAGLSPSETDKGTEAVQPASPEPPAAADQQPEPEKPPAPVEPDAGIQELVPDRQEPVPVSAEPGSEPGSYAPAEPGGGMFQGATPADATEAEPPPPVEAEERPAEDDDEALLAGLDEETVKLIRVKQRLSGGKLSVRELLEQLPAERKSEAAKPQQRNRWWRRSNER